ncbi:MAG TPA: helix-turn-helix domain-containing protein [Syntrophales bacterium]|nr:helix-turn-helix domain-containing protein [Syntrophales bacterium]
MERAQVACKRRERGYDPYISALERGEVDPPLSLIFKVAEVLGIDPRALLAGEDIPMSRLWILDAFIKYLAGKEKPLHLETIQGLMEDAMAKRPKGRA